MAVKRLISVIVLIAVINFSNHALITSEHAL